MSVKSDDRTNNSPDQPCGSGGNHDRNIDNEITDTCFGHGLKTVEPKSVLRKRFKVDIFSSVGHYERYYISKLSSTVKENWSFSYVFEKKIVRGSRSENEQSTTNDAQQNSASSSEETGRETSSSAAASTGASGGRGD